MLVWLILPFANRRWPWPHVPFYHYYSENYQSGEVKIWMKLSKKGHKHEAQPSKGIERKRNMEPIMTKRSNTFTDTLTKNRTVTEEPHPGTISSKTTGNRHLTLKAPSKPASENIICLCRLLNILANFSNLFLHTGKQCGPRSDWSGSTLFAEMKFKITSRWQSRRQLLWLAV